MSNPYLRSRFEEIADKLPPMRSKAYRLLHLHGPATAAELVEKGHLYSIGGRGLAGNMSARLGELVAHKSAWVVGERKCRVTGNTANVYSATEDYQPLPKRKKAQPHEDPRRTAVIEAAIAYRNAINGLSGSMEPEDAWVLLDEAVEALEDSDATS